MIYAIGDIHGCLNQLKALSSLLVKEVEPKDTIVFLGDYVDRGPDSKGVIDFLRNHPFDCNVVFLKGNHEEMMYDALMGNHINLWISNGGNETIASYNEIFDMNFLKKENVIEDREWLGNLKTSYMTDKFFFCHAGVTRNHTLNNQPDSVLLWVRDKFLNDKDKWEGDRIVVHGHTPVPYDPESKTETIEPIVTKNRINLDIGCFFYEKLAYAKLNDDTGECERIVIVDGAGNSQSYKP